jgi:hypothetical protein
LVHSLAGGGAHSVFNQSELQALFSYRPALDGRALQRGLLTVGDPLRMRTFANKLLTSACYRLQWFVLE